MIGIIIRVYLRKYNHKKWLIFHIFISRWMIIVYFSHIDCMEYDHSCSFVEILSVYLNNSIVPSEVCLSENIWNTIFLQHRKSLSNYRSSLQINILQRLYNEEEEKKNDKFSFYKQEKKMRERDHQIQQIHSENKRQFHIHSLFIIQQNSF
jgi:hypothetical protein